MFAYVGGTLASETRGEYNSYIYHEAEADAYYYLYQYYNYGSLANEYYSEYNYHQSLADSYYSTYIGYTVCALVFFVASIPLFIIGLINGIKSITHYVKVKKAYGMNPLATLIMGIIALCVICVALIFMYACAVEIIDVL